MHTEISVGFNIGMITEKKVLIGLHPSIIAASSISSGIDFINPVNINTASPAPKPRYIIHIRNGVSRSSLSAVDDRVNMSIWNGTTIEKTNRP